MPADRYQGCGLELSSRVLRTTGAGPLLEISVAGGPSVRISEHEQARALHEFVSARVAESRPAGLAFDLRRFRYRHGDSIGSVFLQPQADGSGFIPISIVAKGRTRRGLTSLLGLFSEAYGSLNFFTDQPDEALAWLERMAGSGPNADS